MLYLHFDTWDLGTKWIYISNDIYTAILATGSDRLNVITHGL